MCAISDQRRIGVGGREREGGKGRDSWRGWEGKDEGIAGELSAFAAERKGGVTASGENEKEEKVAGKESYRSKGTKKKHARTHSPPPPTYTHKYMCIYIHLHISTFIYIYIFGSCFLFHSVRVNTLSPLQHRSEYMYMCSYGYASKSSLLMHQLFLRMCVSPLRVRLPLRVRV